MRQATKLISLSGGRRAVLGRRPPIWERAFSLLGIFDRVSARRMSRIDKYRQHFVDAKDELPNVVFRYSEEHYKKTETNKRSILTIER